MYRFKLRNRHQHNETVHMSKEKGFKTLSTVIENKDKKAKELDGKYEIQRCSRMNSFELIRLL